MASVALCGLAGAPRCRPAASTSFYRGELKFKAIAQPRAAPQRQQSVRRRGPPALRVFGGEPVWYGDRDVLKEENLRLFRTVYTHKSWAAHRSTNRYVRHFMGMFRSRIVWGLRWPLFLMGLEATFVCAYETLLKNGVFPAAFRSIQIKAPMLFSLSSFALSLLLVFRTNQSYARFDEGRRLWSVLANRCRDVMRQTCSYLGPSNTHLLGVLSRWMQAFPWVLKNYVRETKSWDADLENLLQPDELAAVRHAANPPLMALQIITEVLDRLPISTKQRLRLDVFCADLGDVVGASERLLTTPIPLSYTRHTARFLAIWLVLLPFAIYNQCGWVTVLSSVILAFFLLSIEEIGVTIEEPFNILPLEDINRRVCRDMARYPSQMASVIALVDGSTGTIRPEPQAGFLPIGQFTAAKTAAAHAGSSACAGGGRPPKGSSGAGGGQPNGSSSSSSSSGGGGIGGVAADADGPWC